MNTRDIIRAWKDELFRKSLSSDQQALLPAHPAGEIVLSTEEMANVNGGIVWTDDPGPFGCMSTDASTQQNSIA
jgi:mersacidin/lichenicidin family type 2 lantibiotic